MRVKQPITGTLVHLHSDNIILQSVTLLQNKQRKTKKGKKGQEKKNKGFFRNGLGLPKGVQTESAPQCV